MATDGAHSVAREFPADPGPPGAWSDRVAKRERLLKVRVTQAGLDRLDAKARKMDMTRSAAIRAALREWLEPPRGSASPAAHFDVVAASKGEPAWADHRHRRTPEPVSSEFVAGRRVERFGCQEPGCEVTFE